MDTIDDLRKYIASEYGVSPDFYDNKILKYRAITFEKNTVSVIEANKRFTDMWTVKRNKHSIDFFHTDELVNAVGPGGSLLYWFMPESRM